MGSEDDGGYLIPPYLDNTRFCFSPGVADNADFEEDMYKKFGIKSFLADASVDAPPFQRDYFDFEKKFIGNKNKDMFITMDKWISSKVGEHENHMLLQMDIEGGEYDALLNMSEASLERFDYLLIEFHLFSRLYYRDFLQMVDNLFEKIFKYFFIAHIHPNNCDPFQKYKHISMPNTLEFTFVNNEIKPYMTKKEIKIPHELDKQNLNYKKDIVLPKIFWQK